MVNNNSNNAPEEHLGGHEGHKRHHMATMNAMSRKGKWTVRPRPRVACLMLWSDEMSQDTSSGVSIFRGTDLCGHKIGRQSGVGERVGWERVES